jgi:cytochrome oxidase Cu insertion factor (SCO1/SenC/PrrC family)
VSDPIEGAEEPRRRGVGPRFAVGAVAIAALAGVTLGLGVHQATRGGSGDSSPDTRLDGQAIWPAGFRRAPDFSLPDQSGGLFSLASSRGRSVVLMFMDSRCHQECPLEGRALAAGLRRVPSARRPLVVIVSVNPWEDTPASAHHAIKRFGLASFEWRWLLGSKKRLEPVWHKFRIEVHRTAGDIEHSDALYLIDPRGFERAGMVYPFLPSWVSNDLKTLAAEGNGS